MGSRVLGVSGTNGIGPLQFIGPKNVGLNDRGVYVPDSGNNRIQCFNPLENGVYQFAQSDVRLLLSTNLNQPFAVAPVVNLTNELFYVADTGNKRVVLYSIPVSDPTPAWSGMVARINASDISGTLSNFSGESISGYRQSFVSIGTNSLISDISQIGPLTPVFIKSDTAEYYFETEIEGHAILFTVDFIKENGVWKIMSF
jgi:hypothetical protein